MRCMQLIQPLQGRRGVEVAVGVEVGEVEVGEVEVVVGVGVEVVVAVEVC